MDYSQFLHMREELSLVVVLLLLFLADLFMSPDAHKNDGKDTTEHNATCHSDGGPYSYQPDSGELPPTYLVVCITMYPCTRLSNQS